MSTTNEPLLRGIELSNLHDGVDRESDGGPVEGASWSTGRASPGARAHVWGNEGKEGQAKGGTRSTVRESPGALAHVWKK